LNRQSEIVGSDITTALCRFCGGAARPRFRTSDLNRNTSGETFSYLACNECGVIFLHPVPQDLSAFYATGYHSIPRSLDELRSSAEADRYKLDMVRRFASTGRLLEIGPGIGAFAYLAKDAGFEVAAVEMDAECCRFLNQEVGIQTIHSSDPRVALAPTQTYDVIAMWQVLEHLPDPLETLELAARCLSSGGILVVATPNPTSLQFRVFQGYWAHVDAPRHLQLIPIDVLRKHAVALGLRVEAVTATDAGGRRHNSFGWRQSTLNAFGKRRGVLKLGGALSRLAPPIETRGMLGSCYVAVFSRG